MAGAVRDKPILFGRGPAPWLKPSLFLVGLAPLASIVVTAARGALGANPIAEALNRAGLAALIFLVLSLACTPIKILTGWTAVIGVRKLLGLFGFFYACAHVLVYAGVDQGLDLRAVLRDVAKRPFILVGLLAFVTLVPLAVTSTQKMLKRLGAARWRRLHTLAYVAASLGVVHFVMRVKKDLREPIIYGAALAFLFVVRGVAWYRARQLRAIRELE